MGITMSATVRLNGSPLRLARSFALLCRYRSGCAARERALYVRYASGFPDRYAFVIARYFCGSAAYLAAAASFWQGLHHFCSPSFVVAFLANGPLPLHLEQRFPVFRALGVLATLFLEILMTQPLFLVPDVAFDKTAGGETMLSDDPNQWPTEVMQEVYKQCPFVADFEPQVTMDKVDGERGYGFGHLEIQNKTEIQHGADPAGSAAAGIQKVRVPVIIKDKKLQPLDLMVAAESKLLPLTEMRLRQAIFRPQAFDITGRGPGDMSLIGQLYPPYRQNYGFGGGGATMSVGMGKEGSAFEQYLEEKTASVLAGLKSGKFTLDSDGGEHSARVGDWVHEGEGHMQLGKHHFGGYAEKKHAPRTGEPKHWHFDMKKEGSDKFALSLSTVGSYLKKQTNPQALAGASRSMMGRGAQMVGEGGAAAAKGQKYLAGANIAATKATAAMPKAASVLTAILSTITEKDYDAFIAKMGSDMGLQRQFVANGNASGNSLKALLEYTPKTAEADAIRPTVIQLQKVDEGYLAKSASHISWAPKEELLDRGAAYRLLGGKVVLAADETGSATMTVDQPPAEGEAADKNVVDKPVSEPESPEEDKPMPIDHFGMYKVQDEKGRHLVGYVFPNLIDVDGTSLPIALFTNGSHYAVQSDIAGVHAGHGGSIFEGTPKGVGCFYHVLQNGKAEATIPMTVKGSVNDQQNGGAVLHCITYDGREVQVSVQPNIQKVMPSPDGDHLLIPDTFSWLPLDKAEDTTLVEKPEGFSKEAQARRSLATVTLRGGGGAFSVSGFPVDKLASDERSFMSIDDTLFLLAGLGVDTAYAQKKMGEAEYHNMPVDVRVAHYIQPAELQTKIDAAKLAAEVGPAIEAANRLKCDLVKEAAIIPDPTAVDAVLSLGFLNAENLGVFISYLPKIDEAQEKICELLLAARLGLRNIPVPALEKAMRTVEQVIEGLQQLAFTAG